MVTKGTYFINNKEVSLHYGDVNLINPPRCRTRNEEKIQGIEVFPVFCGFCGTDMELMRMGLKEKLEAKFPSGEKRLINGHEGVVYVPDEKRFAIVLIRGGESCDPSRYTDDENYFEYGCDGADGIFCNKGYFNKTMLLHIPEKYEKLDRLPLSVAKKLVFSDPYACAIFQHERICDLGIAQNFRVEMAHKEVDENTAKKLAKEDTFKRTVIFGLGTTGMFIGDQIRRNHKKAKILFVARSPESSSKVIFAKENIKCDYLCTSDMTLDETAKEITKILDGKATVFVGASGSETESRIAFEKGVLGCNGIYDSFSLGPKVSLDSMPFGFKNQVIFSSINFTRLHMEKAIGILCESNFDKLVEVIDKNEFIKDPADFYRNKIFCKGAPLKSAVIWNKKYIDTEK